MLSDWWDEHFDEKGLGYISYHDFQRAMIEVRAFHQRSSKLVAHSKIVGFQNLGNTCFMAAVNQCLMHTKPLTEPLLRAHAQGRLKGMVNRKNFLNTDGQVTLAFVDLLIEYNNKAKQSTEGVP